MGSTDPLTVATVSGKTVTPPELKGESRQGHQYSYKQNKGTRMVQVQILAVPFFIVVGIDPCVYVDAFVYMATLAQVCTWVLRT